LLYCCPLIELLIFSHFPPPFRPEARRRRRRCCCEVKPRSLGRNSIALFGSTPTPTPPPIQYFSPTTFDFPEIGS